MALKLYDDTYIQDIADKIRLKNGSSDAYKVSEMAAAISNIPVGTGISAVAATFKNSRSSGSSTLIPVEFVSAYNGMGARSYSLSSGSTQNVTCALYNGNIYFHLGFNPRTVRIVGGDDLVYASSGSSSQWNVKVEIPDDYVSTDIIEYSDTVLE